MNWNLRNTNKKKYKYRRHKRMDDTREKTESNAKRAKKWRKYYKRKLGKKRSVEKWKQQLYLISLRETSK